MKAFITLFSLSILSFTALAQNSNRCVSVKDDSSVSYCLGEKVLVLRNNEAGSLTGPMTLINIESQDSGYVQLRDGSRPREVNPALEVAILRGCNEEGVCVGDSIIRKGRNQIFKVVGLFAYGDVAIVAGKEGRIVLPSYLLIKKDEIVKL